MYYMDKQTKKIEIKTRKEVKKRQKGQELTAISLPLQARNKTQKQQRTVLDNNSTY